MEINENTKIAKLIRQDKRSIDVLAGVAKPFEKLRNPLLRKMLAGRTSIKQAAKMGKCSVADIAAALKPLGFEFKEIKEDTGKEEERPEFAKHLAEYPKKILDVRADIAAGKDPLKLIMKAVKDLPEGHVLQIINTFEPTPLINLLEKKGYAHFVDNINDEEVHTWFKKEKVSSPEEEDTEIKPETVSPEVFNEKLASYGEKVQKVDVSQLEMPMPMVTILEALSNLPDDHVLKVHHRRIPIFLFNELKERNYHWHLLHPSPDQVELLIFK